METENGYTYFVCRAIPYCDDFNISGSFPKRTCLQVLYNSSWSSTFSSKAVIRKLNAFSYCSNCGQDQNYWFFILNIIQGTVEKFDSRNAKGNE